MSRQTLRVMLAAILLVLGVVWLAGDCTWVQSQNAASADDALAEKELAVDKAKERKPTLDDVLVSRIDFSLKSTDVAGGYRELTEAVRKSLPNVPEEFAIVVVGKDLMMEGITQSQRIMNVDVKQATVSELLTTFARRTNPVLKVRDPSEQDQKVVWTVGPNPRDPDKKSNVILITTRNVAKRKGYRLPAAFLPETEQMDRLIIRGTPLESAPAARAQAAKSVAVKAKVDAPKKRDASWSKVISRETLEDEVKRGKLALDKDVVRPDQFARGGYKSARRNFSDLAVLFGIIHQYDAMIRWQNEANDAMQRFSRTARNCKVGSIQSFNDAKQRLEDLTKLVRGERLAKARVAEDTNWGDLVDRSPLMQRMEKVLSDELAKPLADAKEFAKNSDQVRHSAELIAAFASVIGQPSMEDADEAEYVAHSKRLVKDARALVDATRTGDHKAATAAFGSIRQNCSNCHADWR